MSTLPSPARVTLPLRRSALAGLSAPRLPHIAEWPWLVAPLLVPVACNPWGSSAFELPKVALLRLGVLALVVASLRQQAAIANSRPLGPRNARLLVWAAVAYLATLALATAFSPDRLLSFFGSHGRQQGLLTQACYVLLFLNTAAALRTREQADRLWRATVWASAPVVAYGLAQSVGVDPLGWRSDSASQVMSTLGRSNFLSGYLVPVAALTAGLAFAGQISRRYVVLLLAQLTCLAATRARAAWLGAAAVAAVFAIGLLPRRLRRIALAAGACAAVAAAALLLAGAVPLPTSGSMAARLTIWRASWGLLLRRPLLGYGPEGMQAAFYHVFPPELVYYQGRGVMVDRAHNLWLDLGLSAGLVGMATFAALLYAAGRIALRGLHSSFSRAERIHWLALLAAMAGHVVEQQFSFAVTASAMVFWLALALLVAHSQDDGSAAVASPSHPAVPTATWAVPGVAAALLAVVTVVLPLLADTSAALATDVGTVAERRLPLASLAVRLWPLEPEYRLLYGLLLADAGDAEAAEGQMEAAVALRPSDPRLWLAQAAVYSARPEDATRLMLAEASYRQALALAPNLATFHAALGRLLAAEGRLAEAVVALGNAVALDATYYDAYYQLAAVYEAAGMTAEAEEARSNAAYWQAKTAAVAVPSAW